MRKLRLFARDAYVGLDLMTKDAEIVTLSDHDPAAPRAVPVAHPRRPSAKSR